MSYFLSAMLASLEAAADSDLAWSVCPVAAVERKGVGRIGFRLTVVGPG